MDLEEKQNLDVEIAKIQKSTRTTVPAALPLHDILRQKYHWYYNWHLNPWSSKIHSIIFVFYLVFIAFFTYSTLVQPYKPTQAAPPFAGLKQGASEIVSKRSQNTKVYDNHDGTEQYIVSSGPLHYKDGETWKDIDNKIQPTTGEADFEMSKSIYQAKFKKAFNDQKIAHISKDGEGFSVTLGNLSWTNASGEEQLIATPQEALGQVTDNTLNYTDAYGPGLDFNYETNDSSLNKKLVIPALENVLPTPTPTPTPSETVLPTPPAELVSPTPTLEATETLPAVLGEITTPNEEILQGEEPSLSLGMTYELDKDLDILIDGELWNRHKISTKAQTIEFQKDGKTLWGFAPPRAWDSAPPSEGGDGGGSIIAGTLTLTGNGKKLNLTVSFPYSWLQTAQYPVTIDPDTYYGATTDGDIYGYNISTYATARSTSTGITQTAATPFYLGQISYGDFYVYRGYVEFDTSGIDDAATVTQANMYLTCQTNGSATDFTVRIHEYNWTSPLASGTQEADYDGALAATANAVDWRSTVGIATNTPYASANLRNAYIQKGATKTQYALVSDRDVSATQPTQEEYIGVASQENTTQARRPYLSITVNSEEGANSPGTMADDSAVGSVAWQNPDYAKVSDSNYATALLGTPGCFLAGTKITMGDGSYKNIEEVTVGEIVRSQNTEKREIVSAPVIKVFQHSAEEMTGNYYLIITTGNNNTIRVTVNHPIWANENWINAGDLNVGDTLMDDKGNPDKITEIEKIYEKVPTYNLEVDTYHTYFAGKILIHNKPGVYWTNVKLVKGGTIQGNNNATGSLPTTEAYVPFGSSSDLWGLSLSPDDINSSTFGFVISVTGYGYPAGNWASHYLKATNFGFAIPAGATINGVKVEIQAKESAGTYSAWVNHMRMTVNYTAAPPATTRYWIDNDGGNWNDTANWSATTGGTGGASVPVAGDTAIFDNAGSTHNGALTINATVNVATLTFDTNYSGTITQGANTVTTSAAMSLTGTSLTAGAAITASGTLTIAAGKTLDMAGNNLTVTSTFSNSGTLKLTGGEATVSLTNDTDSGTVWYYGTSGPYTIKNLTYFNLKIDGVATTYNQQAAANTVNGTFNLAAGTYAQGGNDLTVKDDFTIASSGSTFTKGTGAAKLKFLGDLIFTGPATAQNLGAVEIGASPDTTDLAADFAADTLTINAGDIFNTNGYEVDIGAGGITLATGAPGGTLDTTDDVETDGTIITDAGALTINSGGVFTKDVTGTRSTVKMDGGITANLTSSSQDLGDFQTSTASTHIDLQDNLTTAVITLDASTTLDTTVSNRSINATNIILTGTLLANGSTITASGNWDNSAGTFTKGTSTVILSSTGSLNTGNDWNAAKVFQNLTLAATSATTTLASSVGVYGTLTIGAGTLDGSASWYGIAMYNSTPDATPLSIGAGNAISRAEIRFNITASTNIPSSTRYVSLACKGDAAAASTCTLLGNVTLNGGLTVTGVHDGDYGILDTGGFSVNQAATWAAVYIGTSGNDARYGKLKANGSAITATGGVIIYVSGAGGANELDADTSAISVAGNWTNGDTFTADASTVTFNSSSADQTITTNSQAFNNLTLNNTGAGGSDDIIISNTLDVDGLLTITNGDLDVSTNDPTVNLGGGMTVGADGSIDFTAYAGTWTYNGTGTLTDSRATKGNLMTFTIDGASAVLTLGSTIKATKINLGANDTLNLGAGSYTLELTGTGTGANIPLNITAGGTFTKGTGSTMLYSGSGAATDVATVCYNNLTFTPTSATTYTLTGHLIDANALSGTLTLSNVNTTLDAVNGSNYNIALAGDWTNNLGTFTPRTDTVTFNGTGAQAINGTTATQTFYNIIVAKTAGQLLSVSGSTTTLAVTNFTETTGNFTPPATFNVAATLTLTAGTLTAGTNINVTGDWTNNGGTFTAGANTVTFNSSTADQTITPSNSAFYNLILNNTAGAGSDDIIISGTGLDIDGDLTLTDGDLNLGALTHTLDGNLVVQAAASVDYSTSTFTFNGVGKTISGTKATLTLFNLTVNGGKDITSNASPQIRPAGDVLISGTLTDNVGMLATGANFTVNGTYTLGDGKTAVFSNAAQTLNIGNGGVLGGTDVNDSKFRLTTDATPTINLTGTGNFDSNLYLQFYFVSGDYTLPAKNYKAGKVEVYGYFELEETHNIVPTAGTLDIDGNFSLACEGWDGAPTLNFNNSTNVNTNFGGNFARTETSCTVQYTHGTETVYFDKGAGTQTFDPGASSTFYHLEHSGAGTVQLSNTDLNVDGNFTNSAGTFDANDLDVNVGGNFNIAGGSFSPKVGGGATTQTVTLDGGGGTIQTISGSTTFNHFTALAAVARTLKFTAGTTQEISGTWTITGQAGQLITLTSTTTSAWIIDPTAASVSYVDANYSTNTGIDFCATFSTSTNNHNTTWDISTGATCDDAISLTVDHNSLTFGSLLPTSIYTGTTVTTVTTNYGNGYSLSVRDNVVGANSALLHTDTTTYVADYAGTIAAPTVWVDTGLGICVYIATGKDTAKWGAGTAEDDALNKYAGVPQNDDIIHSKTGSPTTDDETSIGYKLVVPNSQKSGNYSGTIYYTVAGVIF